MEIYQKTNVYSQQQNHHWSSSEVKTKIKIFL